MLKDSEIVCNIFCLRPSLNITDIHIFCVCNGSLDCKVVRMVEDYRTNEGAVTFSANCSVSLCAVGTFMTKDFLIAFGVIHYER